MESTYLYIHCVASYGRNCEHNFSSFTINIYSTSTLINSIFLNLKFLPIFIPLKNRMTYSHLIFPYCRNLATAQKVRTEKTSILWNVEKVTVTATVVVVKVVWWQVNNTQLSFPSTIEIPLISLPSAGYTTQSDLVSNITALENATQSESVPVKQSYEQSCFCVLQYSTNWTCLFIRLAELLRLIKGGSMTSCAGITRQWLITVKEWLIFAATSMFNDRHNGISVVVLIRFMQNLTFKYHQLFSIFFC